MVFGDKAKLKKLEKILHPLVRRQEKEFLAQARRKKPRAAVLEIPLLFETGAQKRCDYVICVTAPKAVQKKRVLQRPGMTKAEIQSHSGAPDAGKRSANAPIMLSIPAASAWRT